MRDADPGVRAAAARSLGQLGDRRAVEPLIAALGDVFSFQGAARGLGALGDMRAVEPLLGRLSMALSAPSGAWQCITLVEALGRLGDRRAVQPLTELLDSATPQARRTAVTALGRIGDPRALAPLRRIWRRLSARAMDARGMREVAAAAMAAIRRAR